MVKQKKSKQFFSKINWILFVMWIEFFFVIKFFFVCKMNFYKFNKIFKFYFSNYKINIDNQNKTKKRKTHLSENLHEMEENYIKNKILFWSDILIKIEYNKLLQK